MNDRDSEIQQRENEVQDLIVKSLGLPWSSTSSNAASYLGGDMRTLVRLPDEFRRFQNSDYYFKDKSIVHFTNIKAALSIFKSSKLRMYNLYFKNDKREFNYASEILDNFNKPTESYIDNLDAEISIIKFYTFILSSTNDKSINKFWSKEYTNNGKGIGLELSFYNNPDNWKKFYLSPVKYGQLDRFIDFKKQLDSLKAKNKNVNYKINLNQIIPFHKESCWSSENEIRLMTFFPQDNKMQIYSDTGNELIKCIKIPILSNEFTDKTFTIKEIPFLKIEKVYLGPEIDKNEKIEIEKILKKNYFYDIEKINYVA